MHQTVSTLTTFSELGIQQDHTRNGIRFELKKAPPPPSPPGQAMRWCFGCKTFPESTGVKLDVSVTIVSQMGKCFPIIHPIRIVHTLEIPGWLAADAAAACVLCITYLLPSDPWINLGGCCMALVKTPTIQDSNRVRPPGSELHLDGLNFRCPVRTKMLSSQWSESRWRQDRFMRWVFAFWSLPNGCIRVGWVFQCDLNFAN